MKSVYIDTHAHLYDEQFSEDRDAVIERMLNAGVEKVFLPNSDSTTIDGMLAMEEKFPDVCYPMMGLHPQSVKKDFEKELYSVEEWLGKKKFFAVGETGLDFYWDKTFLEQQIEAFRIQAQWAKKYKIPLIIHCRESFKEIIEILEKEKTEELTGIFHCFTGDKKDAEKIISLGFRMGIGGVLTFKNSHLGDTLKETDLKHLVLETDSPYLAPVPYRGKRNESSYIPIIAEKISGIKNIPPEDVADITTSNAKKLFHI